MRHATCDPIARPRSAPVPPSPPSKPLPTSPLIALSRPGPAVLAHDACACVHEPSDASFHPLPDGGSLVPLTSHERRSAAADVHGRARAGATAIVLFDSTQDREVYGMTQESRDEVYDLLAARGVSTA